MSELQRDFGGESYGHNGDSYHLPGGSYRLEWRRTDAENTEVLLYCIENMDEGWEIQSWVPDISGTPKSDIDGEEVSICSDKEELEDMPYRLFLDAWNDIKSSEESVSEFFQI